MANGYIDLHTHTTYSDGMFSPKKIIDLANKNNTKILSISDHDTINGLKELRENLKSDMLGVSGVEYSSYVIFKHQKFKLHILGYGFDENNKSIIDLNNLMLEKRLKKHDEVLHHVFQMINKLPYDSLKKIDIAKYCWFDRQLIQCMENEMFPKEYIECVRKYYKENRFSYGDDYELNVKEVIKNIHKAGGLVVLAHPTDYKYSYETMKELIIYLKQLGIDGVEVYQSDCPLHLTFDLIELTKKYELLNSVGSDFHRLMNNDGRQIGIGINNNLCIENISIIEELEKRKCLIKGKK